MTEWRVLIGGSVLIAFVVVALFSDAVQPGPSPDEVIGRETGGETVLIEGALDTAYAEPTPAPNYVDSAALCRTRAVLYGIAVPVGDPEQAFKACDRALSTAGEYDWRMLAEVGR